MTGPEGPQAQAILPGRPNCPVGPGCPAGPGRVPLQSQKPQPNGTPEPKPLPNWTEISRAGQRQRPRRRSGLKNLAQGKLGLGAHPPLRRTGLRESFLPGRDASCGEGSLRKVSPTGFGSEACPKNRTGKTTRRMSPDRVLNQKVAVVVQGAEPQVPHGVSASTSEYERVG